MEAKDIKEGFLIHLHRYHLDFYSKNVVIWREL